MTRTQELVDKWVEATAPKPDPYQVQEDALREALAKPSSTPYADQAMARDAADPNTAYAQALERQRKTQELANQAVPKLVQALLDDPSESPAI